ncbi:hypothetical protein Syun_023481 [Stephania yunnanensis]|uniref:Uncharacterized protein n=1 Tax=Stephania yunnanensis TaxID=152371 RepID=A0AAP0F914_9MAGN
MSVILAVSDTKPADGELVNVAKLDMFVDKLPGMPKIYKFEMKNGVHVSKSLEIGMFMKRWVFSFQNFLLCPISSSLLSSLPSIDRKSFGLNVKSSAIDEDGDAKVFGMGELATISAYISLYSCTRLDIWLCSPSFAIPFELTE